MNREALRDLERSLGEDAMRRQREIALSLVRRYRRLLATVAAETGWSDRGRPDVAAEAAMRVVDEMGEMLGRLAVAFPATDIILDARLFLARLNDRAAAVAELARYYRLRRDGKSDEALRVLFGPPLTT